MDPESFLCTPLTVGLFRSADALPSDRVAAPISDPIDAAYALGYAFAVLNFNAPVQGCARPATVGAHWVGTGAWLGGDVMCVHRAA